MLLSYSGLCTRLFSLLIVDLSEMRNALWIVPLEGAILALPAVLAGYSLLRRSQMSLSGSLRSILGRWPYRLLLLLSGLVFAFEAASVFSLLTESAAYATLYENSEPALLALTFLVVTAIAARGGNSAGGIAAVGMIFAPLMYLLVILTQLGTLDPHWLTPLLGPGWRELTRGAQICAFYFSLLPFVMLLDNGEIPTGPHQARRASAASLLRLFGLCALTVSLLCAVHATLYPDLPTLSDGRTMRLDLFLSTGKSHTSVQLPLLLLWYAALIDCAVFFVYVGGRLAALAFDSDHAWFPAGAGTLSFLLAALSWANVNQGLRLSYYGFFLAGGLWIVLALISLMRKRKETR